MHVYPQLGARQVKSLQAQQARDPESLDAAQQVKLGRKQNLVVSVAGAYVGVVWQRSAQAPCWVSRRAKTGQRGKARRDKGILLLKYLDNTRPTVVGDGGAVVVTVFVRSLGSIGACVSCCTVPYPLGICRSPRPFFSWCAVLTPTARTAVPSRLH